VFFNFYRFLHFFSNSSTAQTGNPTYACHVPKDATWVKDVPFRGHNTQNFILDELCPKPSLFGRGIGISSLNVESNDFRTA
jgi:hypothetical protein